MKSLFDSDYRIVRFLLAFSAGCLLDISIVCATNPDPKVLIQNLEHLETSAQAGKDLLAMGERAIPDMIAGLESPSKEVRRNLALLLGKIRVKEAIDPLVKMAKSREYTDSSSALRALGQIGGPEAAEAIIAALPQLHPTGQDNFCRTLGAIGDNRAIEPLIKLLASSDSENSDTGNKNIFKIRARSASAEALGNFRDPRARAALTNAIKNDPDWDVYHAARQSLYRMEGLTYYPSYNNLSATVNLAITKMPEPVNGAEEYIRTWRKANPNYQGSWRGPRLDDFASKTDIERARNTVVKTGKTWNPDLQAGGVIELLMEYLCNRKFHIGPDNAKALLIRIGKPAIPALENGVKRGDRVLARNCQQCIDEINAASNDPANESQLIHTESNQMAPKDEKTREN